MTAQWTRESIIALVSLLITALSLPLAYLIKLKYRNKSAHTHDEEIQLDTQ
ncbi:hypothetical protein PT974_02902 [Cladobotryum mycophilum]|uniref:Uncharacterized protein n=1 Tax=Cladobotryum mycophilum TaxID=491253 RepID=A0ABR0SZI5_9HYPO